MILKKLKMKEIPYEKLEKVGLTRQMIEDLPPQTLTSLLSGLMSPVLPMSVVGKEGEKHSAFARFHIIKEGNGRTDIRIHPVLPPFGETTFAMVADKETGEVSLKEIHTESRYSPSVIAQLKEGKAVVDYMYSLDGQRQRAFIQLDPETNEILAVPTPLLAKNLQQMSVDFKLTYSEDTCLQNGDLLSIVHGEEDMITMGIDLLSPTGVSIVTSDGKHWRESRKLDWDKYELGVNGCWMSDDDGNLHYIEEQDFMKYDIWNQVDKQNARKGNVTRLAYTL